MKNSASAEIKKVETPFKSFSHFVEVHQKWSVSRQLFSNFPTWVGPNPTTSIYNASIVNLYNATGSLA
jgi:hypothetical protein